MCKAVRKVHLKLGTEQDGFCPQETTLKGRGDSVLSSMR